MAIGQKRGVTPEQLRQLSKDLNLTVAAIADGTGLSKAYISEFRNETRNLSAAQQAQLRAFLEEQCTQKGVDFPVDAEDAQAGQRLVEGLGSLIQRVTQPAILLSSDIPKAQVRQICDLIDNNLAKASEILEGEFQPGGFLGGEYSADTEQAIRDLFGLLATNYLAILILQGRSPIYQRPADFDPKTVGDWLSKYLANTPIAPLLPATEETDVDEGATA